MGCFTIGPSDPGKGRDHWLEMLENPRKPIAQWYPLLETVPIDLHGQKEAPMLLKCLKSRYICLIYFFFQESFLLYAFNNIVIKVLLSVFQPITMASKIQ